MNLNLRLTGERLVKLGKDEDNNKNNTPEDNNTTTSTSSTNTPEAKPVTASVQDILSLYSQGSVKFVSTTTPLVLPGRHCFNVDGTDVILDGSKSGFKYQIVTPDREFVLTDDIIKRYVPTVTTDYTETEGTESNNGVNGEIDENVSQGATGDCWLLVGVLSLTSTEIGRNIIKESITCNADGSVTVTFKGLGVSYTISAAELKKWDTDKNTRDAYSNGDNDMLALELAVEKLKIDIEKGRVVIPPELGDEYTHTSGSNGTPGSAIEGGYTAQLIYFLTGQTSNNLFATDGKNCKTNNQSMKYLSEGLSQEEVIRMLQDAYNNGNTVLTFGLYGNSKFNSPHKAQCTDGTYFSFDFSRYSVWSGHAFAITNLTATTVTFVNPWDSSKEYTMTWEEFAKLGVGCLSTTDLSNVVTGEEEEPDTPPVDPNEPVDPTDPVTPDAPDNTAPATEKKTLLELLSMGFTKEILEKYCISVDITEGKIQTTGYQIKPNLEIPGYDGIITTFEQLAEALNIKKPGSTPGTFSDKRFSKDDLAGLPQSVIDKYFLPWVERLIDMNGTSETVQWALKPPYTDINIIKNDTKEDPSKPCIELYTTYLEDGKEISSHIKFYSHQQLVKYLEGNWWNVNNKYIDEFFEFDKESGLYQLKEGKTIEELKALKPEMQEKIYVPANPNNWSAGFEPSTGKTYYPEKGPISKYLPKEVLNSFFEINYDPKTGKSLGYTLKEPYKGFRLASETDTHRSYELSYFKDGVKYSATVEISKKDGSFTISYSPAKPESPNEPETPNEPDSPNKPDGPNSLIDPIILPDNQRLVKPRGGLVKRQ